MAMHNTNSLLKYVVLVVVGAVVVALLYSWLRHTPDNDNLKTSFKTISASATNTAAHDSAAESLDTLTAELAETKQNVSSVSKSNEQLKKQNSDLLKQLNSKQSEATAQFSEEIGKLKTQMQMLTQPKSPDYAVGGASTPQAITTVSDLTETTNTKSHNPLQLFSSGLSSDAGQSLAAVGGNDGNSKKVPEIPYYTIPANGTSVKDRLMTALVGRIPVKGVVTDPYAFKLVISDDNLAANGLRIPHLLQMVVSGYCEGDLNLSGVRGWVTSLTFVFDDGTISSVTSNDNDIGNFTKTNSLGYLSDKYGNPFIRGKLITNAPEYLGGNIALGVGTGMASAYAQTQTTNSTTVLGNSTSTITGSPTKYVIGQGLANGTNEAAQWWHDREQQSFDAIYVAPVDDSGQYIEVSVNFAKEIHIDYNPKGRKVDYAHDNTRTNAHLD